MQSKHASPFKFAFGVITITETVQNSLTPEEYFAGLGRHMTCDWGDLSPSGYEENYEAVIEGHRIFSAYGKGNRRFWIITEADRSTTTILMPEDY